MGNNWLLFPQTPRSRPPQEGRPPVSDDLVKRLRMKMYPQGPIMEEAAAELTRLRERNAELEKDYAQKSETANLLLSSCHLLESRISSLEATVREMREALEPFADAERDEEGQTLVDDFEAYERARAALASSESVVKSEGEKDGE
jgi:hypothetical protein